MQKSSSHAELLEQRIVLQDKVECKVTPLTVFKVFLLWNQTAQTCTGDHTQH